MIAYASLTHTDRNLKALRAAGWRILLSPTGCGLDPRGFRYALDNGAWTAHQQGTTFDGDNFLRAVDRVGAAADFIVLPDIVAGGMASLALSLSWYERLRGVAPLLCPMQDGMVLDTLAMVPADCGLFIGGTTEWKLRTLRGWGTAGRYVHVGRVNTARRIRRCADAGAQSFDGTSATRYAVTLPSLESARRYFGEQQGRLFSCAT